MASYMHGQRCLPPASLVSPDALPRLQPPSTPKRNFREVFISGGDRSTALYLGMGRGRITGGNHVSATLALCVAEEFARWRSLFIFGNDKHGRL